MSRCPAWLRPLAGVVLLLASVTGVAQPDLPDAIRDELRGVTTVAGDEAGVLVQQHGRDWRRLRSGWGIPLAAATLLAMLAGIGGFYLWRGRVRLVNGRSGVTLPRWSLSERLLHWTTATLFIILLITGLSLLFGRPLLIPLIGFEAFAGYAQWALWVHNFTGPAFALALLTIIIFWFKDNLFQRLDWVWFKQGGGIVFKHKHPSAERMNGGEKAWFWLLCTVGVGAVASGLVFNFPIFGQDRWLMQLANLSHIAFTTALTAAAFGHAYIGTLGMEATVEGMITGRVDASWAEQHHDIWYRRKLAGRAPEDDRRLQAQALTAPEN